MWQCLLAYDGRWLAENSLKTKYVRKFWEPILFDCTFKQAWVSHIMHTACLFERWDFDWLERAYAMSLDWRGKTFTVTWIFWSFLSARKKESCFHSRPFFALVTPHVLLLYSGRWGFVRVLLYIERVKVFEKLNGGLTHDIAECRRYSTVVLRGNNHKPNL